MRRPFTLYKEKTQSGTFWYARFWDDESQRYKHSRSTGVLVEGKKERRYEAEEAARKLIDEVLQAKAAKPKPKSAVTQSAAPAPQTPQVATLPPQTAPAIPKRNTVADTPLIEYLENFWTPNSEYANFKRDVQKHALTPYYIEMNHDDVRRHVAPFPGFEGVTVGSLTKATLKKWLIWLASRKTQHRKKDGSIAEGETLSSRRANAVLQSVRVAIRWAVDNEEIDTDPFRKLGEVTESMREKGVLSMAERNTLINMPISDYRTRLFMLLGSLCGLRRGEMRGLQWGDIADGLITVQHNYIDHEGVKLPKYNSVRRVPVPSAVQTLLDIAQKKAFNTAPDSFILASPIRPEKPLNNNFFREGVTKELSALGITETQQEERFITCHSMRHTFVTLAQVSGVPDVVISALAGHKSIKTTGKYSHVPQIIDFNEARNKIESSYLPEKKAVNQ
jgi:integrase